MTRRTLMQLAGASAIALAQNPQAQKDCEKWLALADQGKYGDCWKSTTQHYREQLTQAEWEGQIRKMRGGVGTLTSRKLTVMRPSKTLAGAPDGEYMILEYASDFSNKPKAVETVVLSREGNSWRLAGYFIK